MENDKAVIIKVNELYELNIYEAAFPDSENTLTCFKMTFPHFNGDDTFAKSANKFYEKKKNRLISYYSREAKKAIKKIDKKRASISYPLSIEFSFSVNDETESFISITRRCTVRYPDSSNEKVFAEVWDRHTGTLVSLYDLLPPEMMHRRKILHAVYEECLNRHDVGFHDRLKRRIAKYFDTDNFYIDRGRPMLFYQPGELAPNRYGIVAVPLPFVEK